MKLFLLTWVFTSITSSNVIDIDSNQEVLHNINYAQCHYEAQQIKDDHQYNVGDDVVSTKFEYSCTPLE